MTIAADYYALGLVLYRMLSGGLPPAASTALPADVKTKNTRLWNGLLAGLLVRDPSARLTDRETLRRILARIASGRRAAPILLAGAALLAFAALLAALALPHGGHGRPADAVGGDAVPARADPAPRAVPAAADAAPRGGKAPSRHWERKAREKVLPPWKSLKAILDKHLPESLAAEWRRKADGEWAARA